jgi:tetratricopeptide (TPR) repeat protein
MRTLKGLAILYGFAVLSGCAGVGIVATGDPLTKLNDAEDLFMRQDRPLPAERLIREAMAIYEQRGDQHGLANANRQYGDLLRSSAVQKWEKVYRRDGFQDKSITFDNRLEKATEFYRKALTYYGSAEQQHQQAGKYDALTNVYFNAAWSHLQVGEREKACGYYDKTIQAYDENVRRNPGAKPYIPPGSGSFAEFVGNAKRRVGC